MWTDHHATDLPADGTGVPVHLTPPAHVRRGADVEVVDVQRLLAWFYADQRRRGTAT